MWLQILWKTLLNLLKKESLAPIVPSPVVTTPSVLVPEPTTPSNPMSETPKYLWDTPANVRHSIRVICDELGFTLEQKNTMCATIQAESGGNFDTKAINKNYKTDAAGKLVLDEHGNKILLSTDWGLCQWNDYYHGKEISGGYEGEAMNNPEKAVRLMAIYWKLGEKYRQWWIAYKNGLYKRYL